MEGQSLIRTVIALAIALSGANQETAQQQTNAPGHPATLPRTNLGGARLGSLVLSLQLGLLLAQKARAKEAGRERKEDPLHLLEVTLLKGGALEKERAAKAIHLPLRKIGHQLLLPRKRSNEEPRLQGTRISLPASDG